jgi:hypothetical protein
MIKRIIISLIMVISLSSCFSPGVYVQKSTNTPAFEGKNEFKLSTTTILNELSIAYTPVNHLGIIANGISRNSEDAEIIFNDQTFSQNQKYRLGEVGLGYYTNWNNNKFFFETYGGIGFGKTQYQKADYDIYCNFPSIELSGIENYKSRFTQYFVTPAGGYRVFFADKFKAVFILSSNLNSIKFRNGSQAIGVPRANSMYYFLSPGFTSRVQFLFFELQMQIVNHIQLNNDVISTYNPVFFFYDKEFYSKNNWGFTLGISVNLNQLTQTWRKGK